MGLVNKMLKLHNIHNTLAADITKTVSSRIKESGQVKTTFDKEYYRPGFVHQMDLLFLPKDKNGSLYLLVVIDIGSGAADARTLKDKTGATVLSNLKDIYAKKKYLSLPKRIQADSGSEFENNQFKDYFHQLNVGIRYAATGRHSQQALVENLNKQIGGTIMKLQLNNELVTGETDTNWVTYLPDILELVNENAKALLKARKNDDGEHPKQDDTAPVKCNGNECDLLEIGTMVRPALDYPRNIEGGRLHGRFREGDRRYALVPSKITDVLTFPNQPIRYVVEGYPKNTFSKAELLLYVAPAHPPKLTNEQFIVEEILDKEKVGGLVNYKVKWKGHEVPEWTGGANLKKDVAELVRIFEKKYKLIHATDPIAEKQVKEKVLKPVKEKPVVAVKEKVVEAPKADRLRRLPKPTFKMT
jgi:transposase InsO family protein